MGNVAEMRVIVGDKDREAERAEELRILEALLFAAEAPLDEKTLAARLPAGVDVKRAARAIAKRIRDARRQPGARRRQMDVAHRDDLAWLLTQERW